MSHMTRIFCKGETGADCEAGHLETLLPIKVGHVHAVKGRLWVVEKIGKNGNGETLADLAPANS